MAVQHLFTPIVTVSLQSDGSYKAEVDWSSSYESTFDPNTAEHDYSGESPEAQAACSAVDAWVKTFTSNTFTFPAVDGEG